MRTPPPCMPNGEPCTKRKLNCRAECPEWQKWEKIHTEEVALEREKKETDWEVTFFLSKQADRVNKANHRRYMRERK